ncbi:phage baseplate assembly protein V [uncultured Sphingomonas sp.]|uniref:phage baseplate assembly protein V n=1 Tax=uncultured Sphingomonas sp. TaxID=158754 RepID=UPI00258917E5|nr:phage baseplate assembly protein V [uncultured Sphingomonas sp.]
MTQPVDLPRLIGDLIREGVVIARTGALCRVRIGDIESGDIPWLAGRAGKATIWSPPSIGEQVAVLCGEGDLARAIVLPGLFSDAHPAPADDDSTRIVFDDGTMLQYDPAERHLNATVPGGSITFEADDVVVLGNLTVIGAVEVSKTVTATDDVVGGGKSLKSHKHTLVQPGQGVSGGPQ